MPAQSLSGPPATPGFYGKLPARGDFVTRRLPRSFVEPWDAWLQTAIAQSRRDLGESWLSVYLTSPIWSFGLGAGVCGDACVAGVLMPSVDSVGRYFPLTVAVLLPREASPLHLPLTGAAWFEAAEALALSSLDEEFAFDSFDEGVAGLGAPPTVATGGGVLPLADGWYAPAFDGSLQPTYASLLQGLLWGSGPDGSVWWTAGSDNVEPCMLAHRGLPVAQDCTALLAGGWGSAVAGQQADRP